MSAQETTSYELVKRIVDEELSSYPPSLRAHIRDAVADIINGRDYLKYEPAIITTASRIVAKLVNLGVISIDEEAAKLLSSVIGGSFAPRRRLIARTDYAQRLAEEFVKTYTKLVKPQASSLDVLIVWMVFSAYRAKSLFSVVQAACNLFRLVPIRVRNMVLEEEGDEERIRDVCIIVDAVASAEKVRIESEDGSVYEEYSIAIPLDAERAEKLLQEILGEDYRYIHALRAPVRAEAPKTAKEALLLHVSPQLYNMIKMRVAASSLKWSIPLIRNTLSLIDWRVTRRVMKSALVIPSIFEGEEEE